jgi:D-glycero-D-manno-heptose 1,7-bisphosphate phosphatase
MACLKAEDVPNTIARYVLLDRDGVINEAVRDAYVTSPSMVRLLPGAAEAIARLNRAGYGVIVVSNQQCVGKGLLSAPGLDAITEEIHRQVRDRAGGTILDFLYCTHRASERCACRKPEPGLLLQAQRKYGFDLGDTYYVGDSFSDLETARNAGCPAVFVLSGLDASRYKAGETPAVEPAHIADDLASAVRCVLAG